MHTITGIDSCPAIRNALMCRSRASWLVSAKSWSQPASRCDIAANSDSTLRNSAFSWPF
jgi:hypothetical protein